MTSLQRLSLLRRAMSLANTTADQVKQNEILSFWFGRTPEERAQPKTEWFRPGKDGDEEVRNRFADDVSAMLAGARDHWKADPRGRLALVIALDQFTRQLYRGTAQAFAGDARALALAREGISQGIDRGYDTFERLFLYMPLEHAEDRECQEQCVWLIAQVAEEADRAGLPQARFAAEMLRYAEMHKAVIDRFGRYPHRNAVLGRDSTPEEVEFLKQPGSSFA